MKNIFKSLIPGVFLAAALMAGAALVATPDAQAGSAARPTLVELFTSQGCSSCPPADAYLIELDKRDDVIALSMHITYWDYIGWKDPFASEAVTNRQRAYGHRIGRGRIYTPEIIVNGVLDAVGSRRSAVDRAIARVQASVPSDLDIELSMTPDHAMRVSVPGAPFDGVATVWLARYDNEHVTEIERGENRGRTLRNINVVREMREIGVWDGQSLDIEIPMNALLGDNGNDGCVIIVQQDGFGQVLGVRKMAFADGAS